MVYKIADYAVNMVGNRSKRARREQRKMGKRWIWQGNCINSFDENGDSLIRAFADASAFAVAEESATPYDVSSEDVLQSPSEVPKDLEFTFVEGSGVLMGYDISQDVHHFFILEQVQQHR